MDNSSGFTRILTNAFNWAKPALVNYGLKIIGAIVIFLAGSWLIRLMMRLLTGAMDRAGVEKTLSGFLRSLVQAVLQVILCLVILGNLGVQTTSFVAIIGAAGLAIGLALQGSLSNFGSGTLLILLKPFKAGDYIEAAGTAGTVKEVNIFTTSITTPDNKLVIIPNSSLTGSNITNYSATGTRRVEWIFGISYDDDIRLAKEIIANTLSAETRGLKDPAPMVAVKELGESSVNLVARLWVNSADYWNVCFDVTEKVKNQFDEKGITIPFPQRDIHIHQENNAN